MKTIQIEGLKRQFPWLKRYLDYHTEEVLVSRVDIETLKLSRYHPFSTNGEKIKCCDCYLLDEAGNEIAKVGASLQPPKPKRWWRRNPKPYFKYMDETVGEALIRIGSLKKDVVYVLSYMLYDDHGAGGVWTMTIHKSPRGYSVSEWIDKQINDERDKYGEMVDKIDTTTS